jgi:hypothetical protein
VSKPGNLLDLLAQEKLPPPTLGLDGHVDANGYPVTKQGRPDWCSHCAKLEPEMARHDRTWRPARQARRRGAPVGLCEHCLKQSIEAKTRKEPLP